MKHKLKKKINLGCGRDIKECWVNVDFIKNKGVDVIHNLNKFPYPFEDSSVDEIRASHIIEHLEDPNKFIREIWRIGKNGCKIFIDTPHISSWLVWANLTHKRPFSYFSLDHYDSKMKNEKLTDLNNLDTLVLFNVNPYLFMGGFYRYLGEELFFNKFPSLYEKFFMYTFQSRGVHFNLEVLKEEVKE